MKEECLETAKLCWNPKLGVINKTITSPLSGRSRVEAIGNCITEASALQFAKDYFSRFWGPGEVVIIRRNRRVCFQYKKANTTVAV